MISVMCIRGDWRPPRTEDGFLQSEAPPSLSRVCRMILRTRSSVYRTERGVVRKGSPEDKDSLELLSLLSCRELLLNNNLLRVLPYELGRLFQLQTLGLKGESFLLLPLVFLSLRGLFVVSIHPLTLLCRKPFVPGHPQSVPGARRNQKASELHAGQSGR